MTRAIDIKNQSSRCLCSCPKIWEKHAKLFNRILWMIVRSILLGMWKIAVSILTAFQPVLYTVYSDWLIIVYNCSFRYLCSTAWHPQYMNALLSCLVSVFLSSFSSLHQLPPPKLGMVIAGPIRGKDEGGGEELWSRSFAKSVRLSVSWTNCLLFPAESTNTPADEELL